MPENILILGVGNLLCGDDAVGVLVAQALQKRADLPPHVTVVDGGTDGIGLIPLLEAYSQVIIVDAVLMDEPPGTIRRLVWQDVRLIGHERPLSLHQSDLADALLLAEALHCLPRTLVIYGVQPHNRGWDESLSLEVQHALPVLMTTLIEEVRRMIDGTKSFDH
jgi:hydrogenase maturation protease